MAKITLADGMTIEGTAEELRELAKAFGEVAEATEKGVPEFKVGDYAKITGAGDKPPYNSHNFPIGSIVKVDEVGDNEYGDRFLGKHIDGVGHGWWVLNEYAVKATVEEVADALGEDAEETATEPAEEVTETTEAPREGDYVVFDITTLDITEGKPYKITGIVGEELFKFEDDAGDERQGSVDNVVKGSYKLYRPIEGAPQVGDKILVTNAVSTGGRYGYGDILTVGKVNSVRGVRPEEDINAYLRREEFVIVERAGEEDVEESEETLRKQFGKGDKVRLLSGGNEHPLYGFKDGEVYEIAEVNPKIHGGERITIRDGMDRGYANPEQLEKVAEPIEEATEETIEDGDLIRFTENFFGVIREGEIVEAVAGADIDGDIQYRDRDGDIWYAMPKRFVLVAKKSDRKDV